MTPRRRLHRGLQARTGADPRAGRDSAKAFYKEKVGFDIEAARADLFERGVAVSEIRYGVGRVAAEAASEHRDYNSFADFSDPTATRGSCRNSHTI